MKNLYAQVKKTHEGFPCKWVTTKVTFQEYVHLMKEQVGKTEEIKKKLNNYESLKD